jgi:cyclophilin family peptidyl-prolyl cis-trans isomerase/HEAT repeat protein
MSRLFHRKVAQRFSAAIAGLKACATSSVIRAFVSSWLLVLVATPVVAQGSSTARLAILQAEDRRAPTANDVAIIRTGARSGDPQTVRMAVRALGRLERPALIPDITPSLRHAAPEVRVEAATAIGQAAQGWKDSHTPGSAVTLDSVVSPLVARLKVEAEPDVRAAICETIGRLPYTSATQAESAERTLLDTAARADALADRLGVAKGLEALVRIHRQLRPPSADAVSLMRRLAVPGTGEVATGARIRRLALEALIASGAPDDDLIGSAARDPDAQVRRLAMRAAAVRGRSAAADAAISAALGNPTTIALSAPSAIDDSPFVRLEALRALKARGGDEVCPASVLRAMDRDAHVALAAIDQLAACGSSPAAVAMLEFIVQDRSTLNEPRGWHRPAHALVALATAAPERGAAALQGLAGAQIWQVRLYAARAAAVLQDRALLERLANDDSDNVREAAIAGLKTVAGHNADRVYVSQLTRNGYQVLRAAAGALDGTPNPDAAIPALRAALERLVAEGRDNSHDARAAIAKTLASGQPPATNGGGRSRDQASTARADIRSQTRNDLSGEELRRLASPRARITIKDVGTFELALFTTQAPATVLRFAHLAEAGYYNGLTFHRVVANFVIQGGSPGANEYIGDAAFMRDELGSWPHVRGAVGISTRGRDTGDAQIFIDLVDNPRLDHDYTVFAQVLNGIDVVDRILEGDVIERIEIVPGP